ncbi:MAG: Holliday junction branch migration protein RuvA [Synergistetes bacterium]|nr:Holliday junction branch migration protein RuvA [Synergistota bacterium]
MFEYLSGVIDSKNLPYVVIDVNGIGYRVYVPVSLYERLEVGQGCRLYTEFVIGKDAVSIYGFSTLQERLFFNKLRHLPNIGSRLALNIVSFVSFEELRYRADMGDTSILEQVPGVGPRRAARILMELGEWSRRQEGLQGVKGEMIDALVALGYRKREVMDKLRNFVVKDSEGIESALKRFLAEVNR